MLVIGDVPVCTLSPTAYTLYDVRQRDAFSGHAAGLGCDVGVQARAMFSRSGSGLILRLLIYSHKNRARNKDQTVDHDQ